MVKLELTRTWLLTTVLAAVAAGVLSGIPSTVWAFVTDGDPWEATQAAAQVLVHRDTWFPLQVAAATIVHGGMSLFWSGVLCAVLSPKRAVLDGVGAGFSIAVLDMLAIGPMVPSMRELPFLPQLADHLCFGGIVGAVIAWRGIRATEQSPAAAFELSRKGVKRSFLIAPVVLGAISMVADSGAFFFGLFATVQGLVALLCLQFPDDPWSLPKEWLFLVVFVLGMVAAVISIRQPARLGWLFCAHACLVAYFVMSWFLGRAITNSLSV